MTDRLPRPVVALLATGVVATAAMAFAPQVDSLDPRGGFTDAIAPGTDGTAHYESPETDRRVDVQLLSLTPASGGRATVRLRMAADRPGDLGGCTVVALLRGGAETSTTAGCGAGTPTGGPSHEIQSVVDVVLPQGRSAADITAVHVRWAPPAFVDLPAV